MTTPPTTVSAVSAVLLVDQRIQDYETIVSAAKSDVRCVVFDPNQVSETCRQQSITSFQYILNKIADIGVSSFANIGVVQHNRNTSLHQFFGINPAELSTVAGVEASDPSLQTWAGFAGFITSLKTTYGVQNVDLMACALYSNPDWKYVIDTLATQTGVAVRASTDDTGSATQGGNWFLESHTGVNLKTVYFTDAIDAFSGLLDMLFGVASNTQYVWNSMITAPSTLAVWGNNLTSTVLSTTLSAKLINITKVFSYAVPTPYGFIFALDTSGVLYGFGNKTFGSNPSTNIVNVQSNSGFIDYFSYGGLIGLLKSNGTVGFITDANTTDAYIYYTTFTVSNAITAYNMSISNSDPNRRFGILTSNSTFLTYRGPNNSASIYPISESAEYTITNAARFVMPGSRIYVVIKRDRTTADGYNELGWTNIGNIYASAGSYYGAVIFGLDMSNNLLYSGTANGYDYSGIGMVNAPSAARTNVVTIKLSHDNTNGYGLILQLNGTVTSWSRFSSLTQQDDKAVNVYITKGNWPSASLIQASLKYDGTLYVRGSYGSNTYSSQPVVDVVSGLNFIAFLLNNGNVILHTSTNTFVTVVSTNNAVGLYLFGENEVNVVLNDGSLVRYYNGSITYGTSVVTYNGSTSQSNTILNSNVAGVVATVGLQAAAIKTSSSLTSFTNFDKFQYFLSRNNRRINNFDSLNGTYTISDYRSLTLINPFLNSTKSYKLLIPDYQSSSNLSSSPYNIKSNVTIGSSVENFITAIDEGEQFTINGDTSVTYVLHHPFVYTVTTSPTFALTKVTSITTAYNTFTIYGDGGFAGTGNPVQVAPTLSNFTISTKTFGGANFTLSAPTTDNNVSPTFTYSVPAGNGVATISGSTVTIVGAGSVTVTATQSASNGYLSGTITATLTVNGATPTYTPASPSASVTKTFGVDVSFSLTDLVAGISNSNGQYVFTTGSSAVTISGGVATIQAYTPSAITITATQDASGNYATGSTAISVLINRGTPTYLSISQVSKTYGTDVSFSMTTVMSGKSNSSGAYTFSSASNAISISGSVVTILGYSASPISILASQDASGNYASSSTTVSLVVAAATPTFQSVSQISKTFLTDVSFSMAPIVAGMSNSDGVFIFTRSGAAAVDAISINGDVITILAYTPSAVNIDVYQEASGNYTSQTGSISLLVARKVPSYGTFSIPAVTYSPDGSFSIAPYAPTTDSTGVAVTYSSSDANVATITSDGTLVTVVGHGSTTITASQIANGNFASGSTTAVFTVNRAAPTFLKAFTIDNKVFGDVPFSLLPFTEGLDNTDGTYHFSSSNPSIVSISAVDNVTATILAYTPSPITITVDIDACGNYAAATTSGTLTVARAAPTYQAVSQVAKTFGVDSTFSLTAVMAGISNSSGAYTFTSSSAAVTISDAVATIQAYTPDAITITASQDASGNYAASSKTFTVLVARGTPTYQTVSQVTKTYGVDASFSLTDVMAGKSNSDGAYTFSGGSGVISISDGVATILAYTPSAVTLTASQDASGNYASSTKTFTLLINRGPPTYQSVSQVTKTFGVDASFSMTDVMAGKSNSGGAYTFSSVSGAVSISGDVVTILAYTPEAITIVASQAADGNYAASSTNVSLLVGRGTPTLSNFSNVNKIYGDSPYVITPPTSNSSGAFTYESSNISVATLISTNYTSLDFDGINDTVTVPNIGSFSSLTLEVFVYNTLSTNGNNYSQLVSRGANGNNWDWSLYMISPSGGAVNTLRWVGPGVTVIDTNVIPLNTWTHVAVTCNNSQTKIYINGALVRTQSTTTTMTNNTNGIMFGNDVSLTRPYKGRLSDVRIWNVIRTASEISDNYQRSLVGNETGLIGNWKLNQGTAGSNNSGVTTATDSSVSGKNGTLNNFSLSGSTSNWVDGPSVIPTLRIVGSGTSTITATQDASGNYQSGTISSTLTVINPSPTYQPVSQITKTYGTDISFSLTPFVAGISNSSGAYTFSSTASEISIIGDVVTIMAYTPSAVSITASQSASGDYNAGSTTLSLLVNRAAPTYQSIDQITKTYGVDVSFSLASVVAGISNSDGAYSLFSSISSAVSITGDVLTILSYAPEPIIITATQDASGNYAASTKTISLLVNRGPPTYQSVSQVTKTYGTDVSFSMATVMSGISNSNGAYTFSSTASEISISGDVVTILAYTPSAVTIKATQAAAGNYTDSSANVSLLVDRKVPSYGAFSLPAVTYEDVPYSLVSYAPTSESNATYLYSSSNADVATVNTDGTVVTIIGQGYTTITASQDISGNYKAGSTTASLLVNRAAPTFLKAFTIDDKTFGDTPFSLLPFTVGLDNTDGTYHFSSSDATIVSISEVDGVTATIHAYTPTTPVIIYVAIDACGNYAAADASGTLTVNRKVPAYQSVSTVAKTFGDAAFSLVPYMSGISESSGSYTFASSDASAVRIESDGFTATILAYTASAITITATQAASGNYAAGTKTFSLTVARGAPTIGALSLGPLNGYYDVSDGYFTLTAPTSNSSGGFTYASDNSAVAIISGPSFSTANLIARYDPSDSSNYIMENGYISFLLDLTGNYSQRLRQNGNATNVVTVGSKQMLNCSSADTGFYSNLPLTFYNTFFMVIRYNPNSIVSAPNLGGFAQHGNRDTDWSIVKKPDTENTIILKSNNDNSTGLTLTPNTSYILVSRFGGANGNSREFWAYSENGTSSYATATGITISVGTKYMYIGNSSSNHSCRSYIGEMMYYSTAISNSDISNNLSYLQAKWFNASSSTKVVRLIGSGNANISATQDICGNYDTRSVSSLLRVGATVPTVGTFTVSSTTKTYGDGPFTLTPPTSNSDGAFTFTSSDSSIVSISGTTATIVASGTVDITVTQDPSGSFTRKSVTTTFTVQPKNPNLRNFADIVRSYILEGVFTVTDPETDGSGYFTYSSSNIAVVSNSGTGNPSFVITGGGTATITATQIGSQNYAESSISATVTINPITPSASYSNFSRAFDVGTFTIPPPTTASNGAISYTSSDESVATIAGSTVTIKKVGETTITATIAATASYLTRDISAVFTVTRGTPTISGLSAQTRTMTQPPFTLSPTSTSNGTFTYVSDNSGIVFMTNSGTTFNVASVGTATITATITQDTSGNYNSRNYSFTIAVVRATSNLSSATFTVPNGMTYGDTPVNIITAPTSDSSGAITYITADSNRATINLTTGVITAVGEGYVSFIAVQAETPVHNSSIRYSNNMYIARKTVTQTRAAPYSSSTITKYYGDASFQLVSTTESTGSVIFSLSNSSVVSLSSSTKTANITINNVGSVVITAIQLANSRYSTQNDLTWTLTVEKGDTTLSGMTPTLSKNVTDAPFTVAVSSASAGTKSYTLYNPADTSVLTVDSSSGLVTLKGAGTAIIIASQAASSLYNAPSSFACVVTVAEAGISLQGSTLTSTRVFDDVDMTGASMSNTTVTGVSFAGATLTNATMTSATVRNATLTNTNMVGATLTNADVSGTSFAGATMTRMIMTGATLTNSTLTSTDLSGASMANTTITGSTLTSSTMTNAVLTDATLTNSTLTSTVLTGASLVRANVTGSTFVGASLANADMSGATVTNANFTNANISGANITNVAFSPLQKIQLLKNTNNRAIGGIQVSDVSGSTILSAISGTSPAVSIPNIAAATIKVVIPTTSTSASTTIPDVVLDTATSDKFYFPINEGEYFQILGVKYYTDGGIVKNAATNATVEVISYGNKSIWLIAGSIVANVLAVNTISASTFTVPSGKMVTDSPFNITVAPTSNSDAPIVYSSNNTSVATIHPSTGVITIVGQGYVNFNATQAATLLYEAGTKTSNTMFVNILVNFTLNGLNQTILMSTSGLLDGSGTSLESTDATAVFYVKVSDMTDIFKFQTDSLDVNDDSATDVKYYVFNRKWPAALKINPAHSMLNKTESNGMLGNAASFDENKMLAKHDFIRYLSLKLFNTIHGVDLFSNESDLLENATYWGENVRANISNILSGISTTSSDASLSYDVSGNKYLTNATTTDTNICRELMRQMTAAASSRFGSITDSSTPQSVPFRENDSINFKVTFQSTATQNILTGVSIIPSRSYMVKLVMKDSIGGGGSSSNTPVIDSEMYPNAYPYSSAVTSYAPTSASSAVYNIYSPPAPMPFARFGFDGWYYTNSTEWVTSSARNHIKWLLPASSGSASVGSLQYVRVNLKIHNKIALPYIMVYTQSGSSRKYTVTNTGALANGTMYSFYVNLNSYTRTPAMIGYTNAEMSSTTTSGSFASSERILNIALETDSSAAAGTVDFTLSSVLIGDVVAGEKEYGFEADVPVAYP
jgi:uncharacterized protein YjbI with pentapeptide repeats